MMLGNTIAQAAVCTAVCELFLKMSISAYVVYLLTPNPLPQLLQLQEPGERCGP